MQALNYVPNRVAQQLAGKNTRTLGLATSDLALLAPAQIASAIQQRASQLDYHLVIAMAGSGGARQAVSDLLAQRVDALIINIPLDASAASQIEQMAGSLPCIFLDVAEDAAVAICSFSARDRRTPGGRASFAAGASANCVIKRAGGLGGGAGAQQGVAGGAERTGIWRPHSSSAATGAQSRATGR